MRISAFATATHTTVHALRHYEALGLLVPKRMANGYRECAPDQAREAVFIAMSRQVGLSLPVIAQHLPLYLAGRLRPAAMVAALHERRDLLDAQIAELMQQRHTVVEHAQWIEHQGILARAAKTRAAARAGSTRKRWPKASDRQFKKTAAQAVIKRVV